MNEPVKQVTGVLGSRTCFRVELYGENVLAGVGQALVGTVVDIDKCGNRYGRIQLVGIYHLSMVLRRNIYSSGHQILYRMVASSVSIFHFVGICAGSQSHQLMSQTDCENRDLGIV